LVMTLSGLACPFLCGGEEQKKVSKDVSAH
jgi:hypothetical protein